MQVILNQKGEFKCPNGARKTTSQAKPAKAPSVVSLNDKYLLVVKNLNKRRSAKPSKVAKLKSMIGALFQGKISPGELDALVQQLQSKGAISVSGSAITYK